MHCQPDAMQHKPSGLLRDANRTVQLIRTDSVLSVGNQPERAQPFVQSNRRIFKHSSDLYGKLLLFVLSLALPNLSRGQKENVFRTTARAFHNAIRPANRLHKVERVIGVGEILYRVMERRRKTDLLLFHATDFNRVSWCVKYIVTVKNSCAPYV